MSLSVIIPSKSAANLVPCVEAVRKQESGARIIVINDGLELSWEPARVRGDSRLFILEGKKPFCFAANVNIGITEAAPDDVLILNDDALLETPGGFSLLQRAAQENPEYGLIASTCNNVGNRNQWPAKNREYPAPGLRDEPRMVCFVAVLILRRTIDAVGMLDERFVGYGLDDDDYSVRVRQAGLKIGIHDGCYVDHGSLTSSYRGGPAAGGDYRPNLKLFIEKYGVDNWGKGKSTSQFRELFPA